MFTRGRVDREADRHMQIGFLSDKRWPPAPAGHVTPARSPAEHESVECMISAILPPLSYHLSVYLDVCLYFFVCSFATNTVCARPKSPPPLPPPPSFLLSLPLSSLLPPYLHPCLVSYSWGSNQSAVASGWLPGLCIIVFADHFHRLS